MSDFDCVGRVLTWGRNGVFALCVRTCAEKSSIVNHWCVVGCVGVQK